MVQTQFLIASEMSVLIADSPENNEMAFSAKKSWVLDTIVVTIEMAF